MITSFSLFESVLNMEHEIFSAYNGRYMFDITRAYEMIDRGTVKYEIKDYSPERMHFLSHPEFSYAEDEKANRQVIDYTKPIGLIVNLRDPDTGKTEWMLIDGNHRTRKATQEHKSGKFYVIPSPTDVEKFMEFDDSLPHQLFPDDIAA